VINVRLKKSIAATNAVKINHFTALVLRCRGIYNNDFNTNLVRSLAAKDL